MDKINFIFVLFGFVILVLENENLNFKSCN